MVSNECSRMSSGSRCDISFGDLSESACYEIGGQLFCRLRVCLGLEFCWRGHGGEFCRMLY